MTVNEWVAHRLRDTAATLGSDDNPHVALSFSRALNVLFLVVIVALLGILFA